jgi:flagellar protein FliL
MSEAAVAAPKKGKPVVLIAAVLVVLGGGGAAAFFVLGKSGGGGGEAAPAHGAATNEDGGKSAASLQGPIAELPPMIVNLNEPEGTRYLKATIAVSLSDEKVVAEVERLKPVIRDQFIRELSELNFRQTMGAKNKLAVKRRLLKRFNELLGPDAGTEVFLTEFIVQ